MKQEIAKQWVEALRSGKYKQGKGQLMAVVSENEKEYCCLGVLCDLSGVGEWVFEKGCIPEYVTATGNIIGLYSVDVIEWAGMKSTIGKLYYDEIDTCLAIINDEGVPFSKIAEIIEENWRKL